MRHMTVLAFGLVASAVAVFGTYQYTKDAYYAVGKNSGTIEAGADFYRRLTDITVAMPVCTPMQQTAGQVLVAVKAEAIYASADGPSAISLCKAP